MKTLRDFSPQHITTRIFGLFAMLAIFCAAMVFVAGCETLGLSPEAGESALRDAQSRAEGIANDPNADEETRDAANKALAELARILARMEAAKDADGNYTVEGAAAAGAAMLPPPWNVLGLLGIPLIVGGVQEWRKRRSDEALKSVVHSVDALRVSSPQVNQYFKENKDAMQSQLTPLAKRVVHDESLV